MNLPRQQHTTYYHTMREQLEQEAEYLLFLQDCVNDIDDIYFGDDDIETNDCQISIANECGRFIGFPYRAI